MLDHPNPNRGSPTTNGEFWLRLSPLADWQIVRFRNAVIRWFHSNSDMTTEDLALNYPSAQWGPPILPPQSRPAEQRRRPLIGCSVRDIEAGRVGITIGEIDRQAAREGRKVVSHG